MIKNFKTATPKQSIDPVGGSSKLRAYVPVKPLGWGDAAGEQVHRSEHQLHRQPLPQGQDSKLQISNTSCSPAPALVRP